MIYVKRFEDLFLFLFLNDGEFVLPVLVPPKYGLKEFFSKPEALILRHLFHTGTANVGTHAGCHTMLHTLIGKV